MIFFKFFYFGDLKSYFDWIIKLCWVEMIKHAQGEDIGSKALKGN